MHWRKENENNNMCQMQTAERSIREGNVQVMLQIRAFKKFERHMRTMRKRKKAAEDDRIMQVMHIEKEERAVGTGKGTL